MSEPLFESDRIAEEWASGRLDGRLQTIFRAAVGYAITTLNWTPMIVCIYRTPAENDALYGGHGDHLMGVHVLWRGIDVRSKTQSLASVRALANWANAGWTYDPARPTLPNGRPLLVADFEETVKDVSSGPHLHFQTSPATVVKPRAA